MRTGPILLTVAAVVAGCGSGGSSNTTTTSPKPASTKPASTTPQYVPSAHHAKRPPGSVYNDEIGENITTAPRSRVIVLFGPPAATKGDCIRYRIVKQPKQQWEFCFKGERMTSAMVVPAG